MQVNLYIQWYYTQYCINKIYVTYILINNRHSLDCMCSCFCSDEPCKFCLYQRIINPLALWSLMHTYSIILCSIFIQYILKIFIFYLLRKLSSTFDILMIFPNIFSLFIPLSITAKCFHFVHQMGRI